MTGDPRCGYCNHLLSEHCPGFVAHACHKEESRMMEVRWRKGTLVCKTKHCNNPLCDCIGFVPAKKEAA